MISKIATPSSVRRCAACGLQLNHSDRIERASRDLRPSKFSACKAIWSNARPSPRSTKPRECRTCVLREPQRGAEVTLNSTHWPNHRSQDFSSYGVWQRACARNFLFLKSSSDLSVSVLSHGMQRRTSAPATINGISVARDFPLSHRHQSANLKSRPQV